MGRSVPGVRMRGARSAPAHSAGRRGRPEVARAEPPEDRRRQSVYPALGAGSRPRRHHHAEEI